MNALDVDQTVGDLVAQKPALARVFEELEIDYCCGGKKTLEEACRQQGLDPRTVLATLREYDEGKSGGAPSVDAAAMSLTELADHIEQTHHVYVRTALQRLDKMTEEVAAAHGRRDPRLHQVRETFLAMAGELWSHMTKEEQVLFPTVRRLEASEELPTFHCGSLASPIRQMEVEHDDASSAFGRLRELTDGFAPPDWACNTYRAMLEAFSDLEQDMHVHIHKENNVLFPRALEMEAQKRRGMPVG